MDPRSYFEAQKPAVAVSSNTALLVQQLRQDGRAYRFQDAILGTTNPKTVWKVSTRQHLRPTTRGMTTSLDLCTGNSQFLLAGSQTGFVHIYDIWERSPQSRDYPHPLIKDQPIQQASAGLSTIAAVQWYPFDTGIFLTASASGTVCLWDTETMDPVMQSKPFQYTENSSSYALRCMHVSTHNLLAAAGSNGTSTVKLIDLKSGAASHSLIPTQKSTSGVTAVKWSPVSSHILASCAGTTCLWDIRKTNQPLAVLDTDYRPADSSVSTAYRADGSHWRRPKTKAQSARKTTSTTTTATNLAFDDDGQHLVTVCGKRRDVAVWDLRYAHAPVKRLQTFVDASGGGKAVDSGTTLSQPLLLTGRSCKERIIWVAKGNNFHGYSMLLSETDNGMPVSTLRGHLGRVQAAVVTPSPVQMITSAADGLVLLWGQQRQPRHEQQLPDNNRRRQQGRKRRVQDVDSW